MFFFCQTKTSEQQHTKPAKWLVLPRLMNPKGHGAIARRLDVLALGVQRATVTVVAHAQEQHVLGAERRGTMWAHIVMLCLLVYNPHEYYRSIINKS